MNLFRNPWFLGIVFLCLESGSSSSSKTGPRGRVQKTEKSNLKKTLPEVGTNDKLSIGNFKNFANFEMEVYQILRKSRCNEKMRTYLDDYEMSSVRGTGHLHNPSVPQMVRAIAQNSILMFKTIRRLTTDFRIILKECLKKCPSNCDQSCEGIIRLRKEATTELPKVGHLEDGSEGLLGIQKVHSISAKELAQGQLLDRNGNASLNGMDCYTIGIQALMMRRFSTGLEWLIQSKELLIEEQNQLDLLRRIDVVIAQARSDIQHQLPPTLKQEETIDELEDGICAGKNYQSSEEKSGLKCWLETRRHGYWRINPLKVEELSMEPQLIQIHDFLSNEMIQRMKTGSRDSMLTLGAHNEDQLSRSNSSNSTDCDMTFTSWMSEKSEMQFQPIYRKLEFLSGLNVQDEKATQPLKFTDYSPLGSYCDSHVDSAEDAVFNEKGDLLATFLFYLNEVEMGGQTVFPLIGRSVEMVKGSLVFWYNFDERGQTDGYVEHGVCPIVFGRKLIAEKWVMANQNIFVHPTPMSPM